MTTPNDDSITGNIIAAFAACPRVHSTEIRVYTLDGRVRLQGVVETLQESLSAETTAAEVPGVRSVENDLTVSPDKEIPDLELQRMAQQALDDAGMAYIGVRVEAGNAFLMGVIKNEMTRQKAMDTVSPVGGVRGVLSELQIAAGEPVDDVGLTDEVAEALSDDPRLFFYDLDVHSHEGHIIILGDIDTAVQREIATQIAESVDGVKSVENRMTIIVARA